MKRVPFSYSTFPDTQGKAYKKAARENTTVSTVIHNYLQEYTNGEPDPSEQPTEAALTGNKVGATPVNESANATAVAPEAIDPSHYSNDVESLQAALLPGTEANLVNPALTSQTEDNTAAEPVETAHSENNTNEHEPLAEEKPVSPGKKKSTAVKPVKKASSAIVKKSFPKKDLKKVALKPGVAAKNKNQASKSKKSKARS